jgi:hypothetical protein
VTVVLHSNPVTLTTLTANAQGVASGTVTIPATAAVGAHSIVLTGATSGNVDSVAITLAAAGTSGTAALAVTGAPIGDLLLVGITSILAGLALVLALRRINSHAAHARRG